MSVKLKLTYADMRSITRSKVIPSAENAGIIYRETTRMLAEVEHRPVRLVGAGIYNLSGDSGRQMTLDDYLEEPAAEKQQIIDNKLKELGQRYHLDFAGNKDKIVRGEILYRTAEYMRKQNK